MSITGRRKLFRHRYQYAAAFKVAHGIEIVTGDTMSFNERETSRRGRRNSVSLATVVPRDPLRHDFPPRRSGLGLSATCLCCALMAHDCDRKFPL